MKKLALFVSALSLAASPIWAVTAYVVPDVPTDLGGTTFLPSQIIRYQTPAYALAQSLPQGVTIDGLDRLITGDWLVSFETPVDLGGTTYQPNDVVRTNGIVFSATLCGSLVGIPTASNVDAIILDTAGNLVLSFDIPTSIGASTFDPSDLVRFNRIGPNCGDWLLAGVVFDASATAPPIRPPDNVTAADFWPTGTIISLDVPTNLSPLDAVPGHLARWDGVGFSLFEPLAGWPVSSYVDALTFPPDSGTVPVNIMLTRLLLNGSQIRIAWNASCSAGDTDYEIYEGAIGSWYSHNSIDCSDDFHDLTEDVGTTGGDRYYLVVPNNGNAEGSYGTDSSNVQRPQGGLTCIVPQVVGCP